MNLEVFLLADSSHSKDQEMAKPVAQQVIQVRQDKPQGFEIGKLSKRNGVCFCLWGCGRYFTSKEEAKSHIPCVAKDASDRVIELMYRQRGISRNNFDVNKDSIQPEQLPQRDPMDYVKQWVKTSPFPNTWQPQ